MTDKKSQEEKQEKKKKPTRKRIKNPNPKSPAEQIKKRIEANE